MTQQPGITDNCLVARDLDEAVMFNTEKVGYTLGSRMPGLADFTRPN